MFSLFKKKYSPNRVAEKMYYLCSSDEMIGASMQFYLKGKSNISIELNTKLRWHTLILHLFICDFACFQKYGNSSIKNNILDEFYKEIIRNLRGQKNDNEIIKAVISEINAYGKLSKDKNVDEQLTAIGKLYSDSINEPDERLLLMIAGTGIYTQFFITINEWLNKINI
ncbi:MAG: hypothetical protein Q7J16_01685 [Candidatus Cloacimonadales bacterium]|nr:hypothetical protein [Candidatus Cloacimonadales bacterium]